MQKLDIVVLMLPPNTVMTEQNVHVPHSDQQIGKVYYLSTRKGHLLGIQDVLDENESGKGPNGTFSLAFDGIKCLRRKSFKEGSHEDTYATNRHWKIQMTSRCVGSISVTLLRSIYM